MLNIQISQKHYDALKKIFSEKYDQKDVEEYFKELREENFFGDKQMPKLIFDLDKTLDDYGYYLDDTIAICYRLLNKIENNKNCIVEGIDTYGHEYRHHQQAHVDINLIQEEKDKNRKKNIKKSFDRKNNNFNEYQNDAIMHLRSKKREDINAVLKKYFKDTKLKSWFENISEEIFKDLRDELKQAKYLSLTHEYDARVGGLEYTKLVFEVYKNDKKIIANPEMHKWIDNLSKTTNSMSEKELDEYGDAGYVSVQEDFDLCIAESNLYQQFAKAVRRDFDFGMVEKLGKAYSRAKSENEVEIIDYFADIMFGEYIQKNVNNYDKMNKLSDYALDGMFQKDAPNYRKKVACRILQNYIVDGNEKQSEYIIRKIISGYSKNYKQYKFSKEDNFIVQLSCQEKNYQISNFALNTAKKLGNDLRFSELYNLINFVDMYNKTPEDSQNSNEFLYMSDKFMAIKVEAVKRASDWMIHRLSTYEASEQEYDEYLKILEGLKFDYGIRKVLLENEENNYGLSDQELDKLMNENWGITQNKLEEYINQTTVKKDAKFPKFQLCE